MNYIIQQTESFVKWHESLRDLRARTAISRRIDRAEYGNLGDVKAVGCWRRLKIDQGKLLYSVLYSIEIVDQTELVLNPFFY
jgi:putative addiction module killer protein